MARYVFLMKLTDEGARDLSRSAAKVEEAFQLWGELDGELVSLSATLGEYDFVGVVKGPHDEAAAFFAAELAKQGVVTTVTMRAFGISKLRDLLSMSPIHLLRYRESS